MTVVPVTTETRRKRHLAHNRDLLTPVSRPDSGRSGNTLCGSHGFDQTRYDAERASGRQWKDIRITDLPPCRQCDKAAAAKESPR